MTGIGLAPLVAEGIAFKGGDAVSPASTSGLMIEIGVNTTGSVNFEIAGATGAVVGGCTTEIGVVAFGITTLTVCRGAVDVAMIVGAVMVESLIIE